MTYDDAGVIKKVIFKKCGKDNLRNDLYILGKTVLYKGDNENESYFFRYWWCIEY